MTLVVDLSDVDSTMINAVGGKALNLGIMSSGGLPVPGGFCVTTDAYRLVVRQQLDDLMDKLTSATDTGGVAAAAEEARRRVMALEAPAELRTAITDHYEALGDNEAVAVRSSATAEDLAYASFAGQQDTYLNVMGSVALLDAVRRCWASLWTDRAVSYRNANGIDHRSVALAVVVQRMIDATAAGVMFTANPVTSSRNETVIDASPGLGEAVVSGAVNPDHFVVNSVGRRIVARRLGDKRVMITGLRGGGTERRELVDQSSVACLDDEQVLQLADLGQQVQQHYGAPQDTEWALDAAGRFWLTQARPITTLYPLPRMHQPGLRVLMCLSLAQGLTRPITPMGIAAIRLIGTSVATAIKMPPAQPLAGPPAMHAPGQRLFMDITSVLRNRIGRKAVIAAFGVMEARASAVLKVLGERPEFSIIESSDHTVLRHIAGALIRNRVPVRVVAGLANPELAYRGIAATERRLRRTLTLPANATATQRLDFVEQRVGDLFLLMPRTVAYAGGGLLMLAASRRLLRDVAQPGELQEVLRGLPHNVTTEMDLKLWEVTEEIRNDEPSRTVFTDMAVPELLQRYRDRALPPVAQRGLQAFLRRYGHRAVAEIDLGMPRWSDDPSHLLGVISNYLRLDTADLDPVSQFTAGQVRAESMITSLTTRLTERSRVRARLAGWTLRRVRQLIGLRESPKFLLIVALGVMRELLKDVGRELADARRIDQIEDVFFLDLGDARRGLAGEDVRSLVAARREAYQQELRRRHIPRLLLSDGTEPEAVAAEAAGAAGTDGALTGSPASTGTVTARARVVLDPVGAHLEPGEILVAPSTDPGWTPLFLTAGGLVMEMGGSNSHGAVVAREYGIPAVVGVPEATHKIETGQLITVDGAAGLVTVAA
ncbi:MAG TPA: PEP/pyruvate-binding domain-containing protein [Propionibacteriaceae bacterium]|nr:PEP/pyruvate-binding domain-containing protein [Propionibacteriaceae bacterium]